MVLFLITFLVMAIVVLAMSVGVIFSNRRINGSCGGLSALGIERVCDCPEPCAKRRREMADHRGQDDASVIRFR